MKTNFAPWEQQPGESDHGYTMFSEYRDLGVSRRLQAIANDHHVSLRTIAEFSSTDKWVERARAYDKFILTKRYNKMALELEKLEDKKLTLKLNISRSILGWIDELDDYFKNTHKLHNNETANSKIKYLTRLTTLTTKMFRAADLVPNSALFDAKEELDSLIIENYGEPEEKPEPVKEPAEVQDIKSVFSRINKEVLFNISEGLKGLENMTLKSYLTKHKTEILPFDNNEKVPQQTDEFQYPDNKLETPDEIEEYLNKIEEWESSYYEKFLNDQGLKIIKNEDYEQALLWQKEEEEFRKKLMEKNPGLFLKSENDSNESNEAGEKQKGKKSSFDYNIEDWNLNDEEYAKIVEYDPSFAERHPR